MSSSSLGSKCVIIDLDGITAKVGFSGECRPRFMIPFDIESIKQDWNTLRFALSSFFQNVFYNKLHVKSRSIQVLILENLYWPKLWRDCVYTVLFYDFQVSAICFQPSLFMNILATGRSSGIVVSVQQKECVALCFAYHRPILPTLVFAAGGVQSVIDSAKKLTDGRIRIENEEELLRNVFSDDSTPGQSPVASLSTEERQGLQDVLTTGLWTGLEGSVTVTNETGLADLVLQSLSLCAADLRQTCAQQVSVCSSLGNGFNSNFLQRLHGQLQQAIPQSLLPLRNQLALTSHTAALAFLGASLFASLPSNQEKFLYRDTLLPALPSATHALLRHQTIPATTSDPTTTTHRQANLQPEEDEHQLNTTFTEAQRPAEYAVRLIAPDWLAIDATQWVFFRPHPVAS